MRLAAAAALCTLMTGCTEVAAVERPALDVTDSRALRAAAERHYGTDVLNNSARGLPWRGGSSSPPSPEAVIAPSPEAVIADGDYQACVDQELSRYANDPYWGFEGNEDMYQVIAESLC